MDMWKAFRNSNTQRAPQASILFGSFHMLCHLSDALDTVRKSIMLPGRGQRRTGVWCRQQPASKALMFPGLYSTAALDRVDGVRLDPERADRLRRRHTGGPVPALLDVVVGDDRVLLLAGEAGVLGQGVAE